MPAWWPRKSRKSKSEDSLPASPHSNPLSPSVKNVASKAAVSRDSMNHHHQQPQLQGAIASGGFSGFDSDGREGIGLPLPRPSISSTHSFGIENGSSSVSSVSSSGSGDDHQLDPVRRPPDIKFNARSRSPGPASRGPTSPTSPQSRFARMNLEGPSGRQEAFRSESHPLPLPPSSPTSPSALSYMKSPMLETTAVCASSKWKKGKLLGKGTFGNVYIGFNSETGNMCAIKEVRVASDDRSFKESLKQLHQEINLLSQLSHPNIVQYYGSEFEEDSLSVYLEYVSAGSIHKLLQEYSAFKEPVIQNYTRQIVHGLAYLHGKSVVHRDIKGANILVDPNGDIKLADFGMAKHIANCTAVLSFKGSPYWMAPEVIMNTGHGYNTAVDIWSLGCTILEMATSKPPWSQYEGVAAIFKIGNSKDVPNIPEHLSTEAKSFIRLCLQREPSARPTALQLLDHPFIWEQTSRVLNGNTNIGITKDPYAPSPFDGSRTPPSLDPFPDRTSTSRMDPAGYAVKPLGTSSRALWSPRETPVRVVAASMPVSPSSSPLRQFGGPSHSRSCLPSPPHPFSPAGKGHCSYTVTDYSFQLPMSPNNTRFNFEPWQQDTTSFFRSQTPPPGGSPRTRII